jgi:predicted HicB family RNase H-like nuclease
MKDKKVMVRIKDSLRGKAKKAAKKDRRTLEAYVEIAVEEKLGK